MTTKSVYRVLIVEDEPAMRRLLLIALKQQGFHCDVAEDGLEAERLLEAEQYEAVVTDLRMPNRHGHALATHLLTLEERPVIVVHTGIIEPRMAKDLLSRGVDDIMFKPCDLGILAVKVRTLVDRVTRLRQSGPAREAGDSDCQDFALDDAVATDGPVAPATFESKLSGMSRVLPISNAAHDVYAMTSTDDWNTGQIAAAIQREATLAAEVLRLANSSYYNTSGQQIADLERAVVQIGQKRVGELALATNALAALTSAVVPWMDLGLAWQQSIAAGLAVEMLTEQGGHEELEDGLLLCAIMHPLGRVILGSLFPQHYRTMIKQCQAEGLALKEQEQSNFPITHGDVVARLLASWKIPKSVYGPLAHIDDAYPSLSQLAGPNRIKGELVKLAILVGRLAVGRWESWDWVDLPPSSMLRRLRISNLAAVVDQVRKELGALLAFKTLKTARSVATPAPRVISELFYCDLAASSIDTVGLFLTSLGFELRPVLKGRLKEVDGNVAVNGLGVDPLELAEVCSADRKQVAVVSAGAPCGPGAQERGTRSLVVPGSFGRMAPVIEELRRAASAKRAQGAKTAGKSAVTGVLC